MGIFINTLAIVCSTLVIIIGTSYFMREKAAGKLRYYLLIMSIFGAFWSGGYGLMGFMETPDSATLFRGIGLVGVIGFMMTESLMIAYMISIPKWLYYLYEAVYIVFSVVDLACYAPNPELYTIIDGRMCFYSQPGLWRTIHYSFLAFVSTTLIAMAINWTKKESNARRSLLQFGYFIFHHPGYCPAPLRKAFLPQFGLRNAADLSDHLVLGHQIQ